MCSYVLPSRGIRILYDLRFYEHYSSSLGCCSYQVRERGPPHHSILRQLGVARAYSIGHDSNAPIIDEMPLETTAGSGGGRVHTGAGPA